MVEILSSISGRNNAQFPPYRLIERDYLKEAQLSFGRLERLYHIGQKKAWDGREVLDRLLQRHGGISLPAPKKEAIARVFSIILWGELAAWHISAEIAEALDDVEAKMAATGQAFDEARHFYTMRDYLLALGVDVPPLDGYTRAILVSVLEAGSLVEKLIGMQLLVENVAVHLFRGVAKGGVEPVLAELMPYFEQDEARHVGLGVMFLPAMLAKLSRAESLRLQLFQVKVTTFIVWATILLRESFEALGVDLHRVFRNGISNQLEIFQAMGQADGGTRGIYIPPDMLLKANNLAIDFYFPRPGAPRPRWLRLAHDLMSGTARLGERVLEWAA
ncbi:MAG: ferritin-like domain-containing protein [Candidatus Schekmanbacteria bacterium]|nr:ferritin-like domain-containing protein [Candidatus Schekmanbacteria bacterium]